MDKYGNINVCPCRDIVYDWDIFSFDKKLIKNHLRNIRYRSWGSSAYFNNGRTEERMALHYSMRAYNVSYTDALPQALILTAIVINFAVTALFLVLAYRAYQVLGTDDMDQLRGTEDE